MAWSPKRSKLESLIWAWLFATWSGARVLKFYWDGTRRIDAFFSSCHFKFIDFFSETIRPYISCLKEFNKIYYILLNLKHYTNKLQNIFHFHGYQTIEVGRINDYIS